MEDLTFKFDECVLSPLHENLSHTDIDPSKLVESLDDSLSKREIGMANFKSKTPNGNSNGSVKKSPPVKTVRQRWQAAAKKIKLLQDPWHEFHISAYPVEHVVRHRYNPGKKEWRKDECVVKMETYL